jgi:hypothetical protein
VARAIREQVVVITGASSSIGRATAIAFGQRGASVVQTVLERLSPSLLDWLLLRGDVGDRGQRTGQTDNGRANLDAPMVGSDAVHGEFGNQTLRQSAYTRLFELHMLVRRGALAVSLFGTSALLRRAGR